ncbi:MAG: response regulator [Opitutaceae bacterium]
MRTVLVVDDCESVRTPLAYIFTSLGYRVLSAESGKTAFDLMAVENVEVALVDVMMPVMDGFQTCAALLAPVRAQGRKLPIWLMSGAVSRAAENRAREAGALGLFGKPFDCAQVVAEFECWLESQPRPAACRVFRLVPVRTKALFPFAPFRLPRSAPLSLRQRAAARGEIRPTRRHTIRATVPRTLPSRRGCRAGGPLISSRVLPLMTVFMISA